MELLAELLKITLPAGLVLYGMFLSVRAFIKKELDKQVLELSHKKLELVLPMRVQAYERLSIFLERITPNNLLSRFDSKAFTAGEFQQLLISEIRGELAHNYSQQIFVSSETCQVVKNAVETLTLAINDAHGSLSDQPDATGLSLARKLVEKILEDQSDYTTVALAYLRSDAQKLF